MSDEPECQCQLCKIERMLPDDLSHENMSKLFARVLFMYGLNKWADVKPVFTDALAYRNQLLDELAADTAKKDRGGIDAVKDADAFMAKVMKNRMH